MSSSSHRALTTIRVTAALLLIIHGIARMSLGIVDDFGGFLGGIGFPLGVALAWFITITEIMGGAALALGRWVRPLALYFAAQLVLGIVLVHAQEGWFVVGAGRNGVEYSVLLIVVLLALAYATTPPQTGEAQP
ncbi:MAG: hypothetical protein RhofKO_33920 [Rhodothermales bacterium]